MIVTILQWNIWCDEDVRNNLKFLKRNKADIICLQEMTINYPNQVVKDSPKHISKELGYNGHWQELPIEAVSWGKLMLASGVFSKFPIINKKVILTNNPKNPGGFSNERRAYVEVTLGTGSKKLIVGTTHMSYTHMFEVNDQKQKETDRLINYISRHNSSYIITGDMNAVPGSYTINKLRNKFVNIGPDFSKKTWTTKPFSYNGFEENKLNWRLDHIFATKDIKLIKSRALRTIFSDHLPLLAEIEI